ncbi:tetratricopeptide repeat protein 16 [Chlamydotis macqueenii]
MTRGPARLTSGRAPPASIPPPASRPAQRAGCGVTGSRGPGRVPEAERGWRPGALCHGRARGAAWGGLGRVPERVFGPGRCLRSIGCPSWQRGLDFSSCGQLEEAITCYLKANNLDLQRPLTCDDCAVHCYTLGQFDEAVMLLGKALQDERKDKGLYVNRRESSRQSPGAAASPSLLSFNRDAAAASPQTASFAWGSLWASGLPAGAGAEPRGPVVCRWVAAAQGWQDSVARQSSLLCGC